MGGGMESEVGMEQPTDRIGGQAADEAEAIGARRKKQFGFRRKPLKMYESGNTFALLRLSRALLRLSPALLRLSRALFRWSSALLRFRPDVGGTALACPSTGEERRRGERRQSGGMRRTSGRRAPSADLDLGAVLRPAGVEHARPVEAAIGVGAEIVAQALQEVGGPAGAAEAVVIGEGRRKGRRRDAALRPRARRPSARRLRRRRPRL